jgi:mobilome CxxCx(11)CxxC protein
MSIENQNNNFDSILQDCWDDSLHSFGTAYIYSKKSKIIGRYLKANNFMGIIIPVLIGGIVTSYGITIETLNKILFFASPFSLFQLVLSVLSLNNKWDDAYSYYLESANDNSQLSNDYKNLAKYPPLKLNELKSKKALIDVKYSIRGTTDGKYTLSPKEKREAMRYALRNFQRSCAGCGIIPKDMISTECGVCGKFKYLIN